MEEDQGNEQGLSLARVLQQALRFYKRHFQFFISISLVYSILVELGRVILSQLNLSTDELIFYLALVNIFIASWASIAIIFAASRLALGESFSVASALTVARRRYLMYLVVYLTLLIILGLGFLLLIIPGLYFMTLFLFSDILVVCQKVNMREAFQGSARLVRPYFWQVFLYLMIVVCISLIPEFINQMFLAVYPAVAPGLQKITAVLTMPYLMIAQVVLYYAVRSNIELEIQSIEEQIQSIDKDE